MKIHNHKVDIVIFVACLVLVTIWMIHARTSGNMGEYDFTGEPISCEYKGEGKYGGYAGYLHKGTEKYSLENKFSSCKEFERLVENKKLFGKFMKSNNLIIDLYINDKPHYESSLLSIIFYILLLSSLLWAFLCKPIIWVVKKHA